MKLSFTFIVLLSALLFQNTVEAQYQGQVYKYNDNIKVYAYGNEQKLAWCGGFDNPQFTMGDLNNDGKQDLIVFNTSTGVRTFLNVGGNGSADTGTQIYAYAPEYEANFPLMIGFCTLADYNCDNIPDLFTGDVCVYTGYYNSKNQLAFHKYGFLYYYNDSHSTGRQNVYCSPLDIPAIVDVDGDGDLDILAYDVFYGTHIYLYKNMQVEDSLPCDSIKIELKDRCWGRVYQTTTLTHKLHVICDNSGLGPKPSGTTKKTHTGNTMLLLDYDGDGDMDYIDGSILFDSLVYLQNGRIPYGSPDSMVYEDTTWDRTGHELYMPVWPAAFNVDINNDGQKDILVAPHSKGENKRCIAYYKNIGTPSAPRFAYQNDSTIVEQSIDVGTGSYPMFFDYNKDGKPDLFIGSDGYYQFGGTYKAKIAYYKNTSTPGNPSFTLVTDDFMGLGALGYDGIAPAVGDIDNDDKTDLLLGHLDGTVTYYKNIATSDTVPPIWQLTQTKLKDDAGTTINVGANSAPFVYDINKDGKPDLILGDYVGTLWYYENTSTTPGSISLKKITNRLGDVKVDGIPLGQCTSVPFIGKMDNSNKDYLMVGSYSGELYRFDGFQGGNTTIPYTMIDTNYSYIDSAYLVVTGRGNYQGFRSAPAIADIDGDGKYDMVIGNANGGVNLYRQDTDVYVSTSNILTGDKDVHLYPNPTANILNLSWGASFSTNNISIVMITATGQKVLEKVVPASLQYTQLSTKDLLPGIYYCIIQSDKSRTVLPITIMK